MSAEPPRVTKGDFNKLNKAIAINPLSNPLNAALPNTSITENGCIAFVFGVCKEPGDP